MKSTLIIVGGFLGAGKTSLLWESAKLLQERNKKAGMITNDQASQLVDTTFLETGSDMVKEVSGSCFCCNFNGFTDAIMEIHNKNDDGYILAEPVGSCTDLSATIMQPIKDKFPDKLDLKPLTVLADPYKLYDILEDASSSPAYIVDRQFEEADIILINKTDLLTPDEIAELKKTAQIKWPNTKIMTVSVKTGEGLSEWLDTVISSTSAGKKIASVDYDIYADGEAAYGWLNASFTLNKTVDPDKLASEFLDALIERFIESKVNIGHVKFLLKDLDKLVIGNITGNTNSATLRTMAEANTERTLTVNARVETDTDELKSIILEEVQRVFSDTDYQQAELNCLIPGRPDPTHRYKSVI